MGYFTINGYALTYKDEQEEIDLAQMIEAMVVEKNFEQLVQWIEEHLSVFDDED